jgi:protease I
MQLQGQKIGILIESDFYEKEIFYYEHRFPEEGMEVHFMSRLWGQPSLTFLGHEQHYPFECHESFEHMDDVTLRRRRSSKASSAMVCGWLHRCQSWSVAGKWSSITTCMVM